MKKVLKSVTAILLVLTLAFSAFAVSGVLTRQSHTPAARKMSARAIMPTAAAEQLRCFGKGERRKFIRTWHRLVVEERC